MSDDVRMEIQIYDDAEPLDASPLYMSMIRLEAEMAEREGREPQGWYWVEGMAGPAPLFPKSEEAPS